MKNKIDSIQILRGLAALAVVLFHYRFYLVPDGGDMTIPDSILGWGGIGVDLFFVISGFIIYYVADGKDNGFKSSAEFIVNRLIRIVPLYYFILLIAFLTDGAMSIFHYPDKINNLISALTFTPYLQSSAPLYIDSNGMYNIRWSLNYELYFYLVFSICLLLKPRITALAFWFAIPAMVAYCLQSNFTLSTKGYEFESVLARFLTNPIIMEFGFGVIVGYIYKKNKCRIKSQSALVPLLTLLCIGVGIYSQKLTAYNLLSGVAFSLLVLVFALYNDAVIRIFPRFFIVLGNISFSLYLIHNPLSVFMLNKTEKILPGMLNSVPGFVAMTMTSIVAAYFSYRYVETKFTRKLRKKFHFVQKTSIPDTRPS